MAGSAFMVLPTGYLPVCINYSREHTVTFGSKHCTYLKCKLWVQHEPVCVFLSVHFGKRSSCLYLSSCRAQQDKVSAEQTAGFHVFIHLFCINVCILMRVSHSNIRRDFSPLRRFLFDCGCKESKKAEGDIKDHPRGHHNECLTLANGSVLMFAISSSNKTQLVLLDNIHQAVMWLILLFSL